MSKTTGIFVIISIVLSVLVAASSLNADDEGSDNPGAKKLYDEGNYSEAITAAQQSLRSKDRPAADLINNFKVTINSYRQLNRLDEIDDFREEIADRYQAQWEVLAAVARSWIDEPHYGFEIAGEFKRGNHRGAGKVMHATARDRVRALQLYWQAFELLKQKTDQHTSIDAARFLNDFAAAVLSDYSQAWRLQRLTDLTELPDYEEGWGGNYRQPQGAPVDAEGNPVLYEVPNSWESASSDGQRWRWLLEELVRWNPQSRYDVQLQRAEFLESQFGVQTLRDYGWWFHGEQKSEEGAGSYALHTLSDNETIARLATGIRRFELPAEHNYVSIYQSILDSTGPGESGNPWEQAAGRLAKLYENRRQYPRAAEHWQLLVEKVGNSTEKERLAQITGNWGRFEPVMAQPAGEGATVDFRFRNGKRVEFVAKRIDVRQLLDDVKAYLQSNPEKLDWDQLQLESLGHRLVTKGQEKYAGEEVARWSLDLEPRDHHTGHGHFDRRITVSTPLQEPGAYLLTAKMVDGNTTHVVLWLSDTAIVKKTLHNDSLYYVADSVTGKPVAKCNVEFFGYWHQRLDDNKYRLRTKNFAEFTDEDGIVEISALEENRRHKWVAIATNDAGRFAYLGFQGIWPGHYGDQQYRQVKVFSITDRPVYRPKQKVQYKFWVRHAQYDLKDESRYAAQSFQIEIRDPKNEKVHTEQIIADAYGGLEGEWEIPAGGTLGQYRIMVVNHGGGSFRVEEYKKPEFEVTIDAPDKPVALGEKIAATISAKYYFGSPVTSGTVKYKILRTSYQQAWYPPMPWDWLYGPGYWWFAADYEWYPGWARWGCRRPYPWWFWRAPTPPEVVAEQEVELGPDGTIEVEIDTAMAKLLHPDQDHSYQVQAEVVDESRRTIVGTGKVLVARQPFKVHLWTDKGYYRVGDTLIVGTAARTLDAKPVVGEGTLRLLKIQYKEAQPVETEVGSWPMPTGETGQAELQIKATEPGQYRLAYELTDSQGHTLEGGQLLTVAGAGFDGSEFRFNDLELIPDRREYSAGEKVALQINTNRTGAAVLLFLRPSNGVYKTPQLVRLDGKSQVVEIEVEASDSPNFFVEAVTLHGGKVHTVARELFVPPVKRVLNVEVVPSAEAYLPGQAAKMLLKLTDINGEPYVGSLALSVYDKAVEYITGGSNVPDIREFFWKWRRHHRPRGETSLARYGQNIPLPDKPLMENIGLFGDELVDFDERSKLFGREMRGGGGGGIGGGSFGLPMASRSSGVAAPMAAAQTNQEEFDAGFKDQLASDDSLGAGEFPNNTVEPTVRENFADTALWVGSLETSAEGIAEVELDMPENLTTWKVRVWGMGHGTRVGQGEAEVVTRKNIIVRLQAPRFFVEKDEVVLSANVHNYLAEAKQVRVQLALEGDTLTGPETLEKLVAIEADGEQRVDWRVKVVREGTATIRMSALTDEESDAVQMSFPVYVHGMLKTESFIGVVRPQETAEQFTVTIPEQRRAEQTRLEVRYTPTLAGAMVDALPYLIDYPYGCTEQTLNRFLPAVLTRQTLQKMGLDLTTIREKRTNLNSQELGDDVKRSKGWKRFDRNPVFDEAELDSIVKVGVNRLTEMQLSDGGWGWFSGWGERSYPHTTAVVMHGLLVAQENGVAIVPSVLERGTAWLEKYQAHQVQLLDNWDKQAERAERIPRKEFVDNTDALVYMVLAKVGGDSAAMRQYLYRDRTKLAVYSLATFGLALHKHGDDEKLTMIMRNLSQYVRQDDENQTAWLELPADGWWYWYGSEYEAHAYYLKLLSTVEPNSDIAPRLVKYLLNNRKHATYWKSTRDTALVVEAFADYLAASGEDNPEVTVEVWIDGQQRKQVKIDRENLFTFDNKLVLTGEELSAGRHTVEIRKQGASPIYFNGYLTNFTLEDDIRAAGLELKVERRYFKLTPAKKQIEVAGGRGQIVEQKVENYVRTPLVNLAELTSGDLVEVELIVDSKNDYEYILLEDMKAAGFEPVEVRSGYNGNALGAYMELRDDRVSLFVARLARGKHSVSYRLRAEIPGRFSALPTRATAMYAPELKANSDEIKLRIAD